MSEKLTIFISQDSLLWSSLPAQYEQNKLSKYREVKTTAECGDERIVTAEHIRYHLLLRVLRN